MKAMIIVVFLAILMPSNAQTLVRWDCSPVSYENTITPPRNPSDCSITAYTMATEAYMIRVGVYLNPINSYPDVISAYLNGKYYYYYHQLFNSRYTAELVLEQLQNEGRFCDAYVHQSPFLFVAYSNELIQ